MQSLHSIIKNSYVDSGNVYTIKSAFVDKEPDPQKEIEVNEDVPQNDIQKMMDEARRESEYIIESANSEAERIRKDAYEMGFHKGYSDGAAKGFEDGSQKASGVRRDADEVLREAYRVSREYIDKQKEEIIELALVIAGKIIGYEADVNDEVVSNIVQESMRNAVMKGQVIIRLNPMDYAALDCRRGELAKIAGEGCTVSIVKDSDMQRGGCRVETDSSYVDTTIDSQLQKIREAIAG
jgi:Flagellar biosynthesis/type III secretory pathway protein